MIKFPLLVLVLVSSACAQTHPASTSGAVATTHPATMQFRGCAEIQTEVHGLSGITCAGNNTYWAVADNNDKLLKLAIDLADDGSIRSAKVVGELTIADRGDNEGIAFSAGRNSVFVSEETTPSVREYSLVDGRRLRALPTPDVFLHGHTVSNRGFESLTLSPDGKSLWTANEEALTLDGHPPSIVQPIGSTTRVRLLRYKLEASGDAAPAEQFVYQTGRVHDLGGTNGLCDLAALRDGRLLALERSAAEGLMRKATIRTRIFLVDLAGATDVSKPPYDAGIASKDVRQVRKTPLFDALICDADGENLEGLCVGPAFGPRRFAVIGVVDDTDGNLHVSHTRVVAFQLDLHP